VLAAAGVWLRLLVNLEMNNDALRMISIIAVAVAAWFGGFGPGIFATLIGLAGSLAVTSGVPSGSLNAGHAMRLVLFALAGLIVSALTEALTRTTAAWRRAEEAQENRVLQERNRMAREIHDTLAQGLTGIIIHLEAADDILDDAARRAELRSHLGRAQELSRLSLAEARRSVKALRPIALEGKSLPDALGDRVAMMTSGTGVEVVLNVTGTPYALPADQEDNLLRICLEALTNALRHARAHHVAVSLAYDYEQVILSVSDDGLGFIVGSPQPGAGFGLAGMWERAERIGGRFTLSSSPGKGTEISIAVPHPSGATEESRATRPF
jgi:signal transduction histidine kinase